MERVILSLGSNLGDRFGNLDLALAMVAERLLASGEKIVCSDVFETEALVSSGDSSGSKPDYLNFVVAFETKSSAAELLKKCLEIENEVGRNRETEIGVYDSRLIDIDIVFFGEESIKTKNLEVPHPRFHLRRFVLIPLMQIAQEFRHPGVGKSVEELFNELEDPLQVKLFQEADSFSLAAKKLEARSGR